MEKNANLRPLVNEGDHDCFACSPRNSSGLQMKFFTDGEALFSWLSVPGHLCGWDDQTHGGVVATILDEIMAWTTMHLLKKFAVTQTMTIDFHKPVYTGEEIRAESRVLEVTGRRTAKVEGLLYKEERTLCAKCVGIFRLFTLDAMVRLGGMKEEAIKKWDYLIK